MPVTSLQRYFGRQQNGFWMRCLVVTVVVMANTTLPAAAGIGKLA